MREKAVSGLMLILLFLSILVFMFNVQPAEAVSAYGPCGGIKLSPPSISYITDEYWHYKNTKFNVTVIITNITGCVGHQFRINYNATLLSFVF